ncbi:hypothetical protein AB0O87_00225 [Microbacterium sp. NPDC076768]|uniref:hypothetical protein n=1 Tax=Microbacterium sp. NPDC076768 TaxID=3154858 RepID=UPI0034479FFA
MARVAGRNLAMSWFVGIVCAVVVGVLVWLALPLLPVLAELAGEVLRNALP